MIDVREDDGVPYVARDCVGCGYCCIKTPCDASRRLYPGARRCPQLTWIENEHRYKCGLMMIAGPVGQGYRAELYAGAGCCSGLNSWRNDVKERDHLDMDFSWNPLDPVFQSFIKSLSQNFISSDSISLTILGMTTDLQNKGYSEREIDYIKANITHIFTQNSSKFSKEFIG